MGYLEEIKRRGRDANPFLVLMGIEVSSFGDGNAELSMIVRPEMMNGAGWLQGGLFVALADEAMALALFSALGDGVRIATISESTSFIKGAKEGRVKALGSVVKAAKHIAFVEGRVLGDDGSILSKTAASFAIIGRG